MYKAFACNPMSNNAIDVKRSAIKNSDSSSSSNNSSTTEVSGITRMFVIVILIAIMVVIGAFVKYLCCSIFKDGCDCDCDFGDCYDCIASCPNRKSMHTNYMNY